MPRPTFQKSRGPNGRHLAPLTPYPDDTGLYTTTIKPSGELVPDGGGLRAYTTKDFQDGWDIVNAKVGPSGWGMVLMEDGYLKGLGGGSGDAATLDNVGGVRKNRILFWPKRGWGGVTLYNKSMRLINPNGWTLGGVRGGTEHQWGVLVTSADNFSMWRCTAQYLNSVGQNGQASTGCDFVECVVPNSWVWETDTSAVRGADMDEKKTVPGPISKTNFIGCYIAPTWRPSGSTSHTDTLQWSGDSPYGDSLVEDCVLFSSTNHGMIVGGAATEITVRNTAVIGSKVGPKRHPVTGIAPISSKFAGKGPSGYNDPWALNGTGAPGQLRLYDCIFVGGMTNLYNLLEPGGVVSNVRITSESAKKNDPRFTLDSSMLNWTTTDLDREFPYPSDARLKSIWAVNAAFPENPNVPEVPETPEDPGNPTLPVGVLTQDVMPSHAQAFALATSPTITFSTSPTIAGGVFVAPTDAKVKHTGPAAKAIVASTVTGYYRPNYLQDTPTAGTTSNPRILPAYGTKIRTSSRIVEIALQQRPDLLGGASGGGTSTRVPIRIKVDGQWTSDMPIFVGPDGNIGYDDISQPSFIGQGTKFWLRLEFPTATDRQIELQSFIEYAGWSVPSGQSFGTPSAPLHTIVWDMDSLAAGEKHGTGNYSLGQFHKGTYSQLSSLIWYASQGLGYDNVVNSSAGSSGFNINGDTVKFITQERTQLDVAEHNPELVVIGTGLNDLSAGQSAAQLKTNALTALNQIKAASPTAIRVILGMPSVPMTALLGGATALAPYNAALKAVALDTGSWFLDPTLGDLFNPAGTRVADKANMVTGNESKIASDRTHPTQEGAKFFGSGYFVDMLRLVHPAVGTGTPNPPVDDTDPDVAWITPETPALSGTAILVGTAEHSTGIESVKFTTIMNGQAVALPTATKGAGTEWVLPFNTLTVPSGSYLVTMTAKAVSGQTASATRTFEISNTTVAPNKAPVVTPLDPPANAILPREGQVVFRGRATDDLLVASTAFRLRIGGILGEPRLATPAVLGNGVYELALDPATILDVTGYEFQATDTGEPPLTTTTSIVPISFAAPVDTSDPTDFAVVATARSTTEIDLFWGESVKGNQTILYQVLVNDQVAVPWQTGREASLTGLAQDTAVRIRVIARAEDNASTSTEEITARTWAAAPDAFVAEAEVLSLTSARISWNLTATDATFDVYVDNEAAPRLVGVTTNTAVLAGLPRGPHVARVMGYVDSDRPTWSNVVAFDTNTFDKEAPLKPVLSYGPVTYNSITLSWKLQSTEDDFDYFLLSRPGLVDLKTTATSTVEVGLASASPFTYSVRAVDLSGNQSPAATITVVTPAKPVEIAPRWVSIHGPVADGAGPATGTILVSYSHDVTTLDGISLTTAPQLVVVTEGEFYNAQTGLPVQLYRSSNPEHYIVWVERYQTVEGASDKRPRKFRLPSTTQESVGYKDFIWFEQAQGAAPMPPWAENLEAQVLAMQKAAETVTDAIADLAFTIVWEAATQRYVIDPRGNA